MYKRRARLVFAALAPGLAERAARVALAHGAGWIEARPGPAGRIPADCDLLITLDAAADALGPDLPAGCRHIHWPLPAHPSDADIAARIEGLVGGMRLLARLDGSGAPGA
ncbi:hypothetical protein [Acidiferrobacter sp.]|uniref:hypothetical protein n=1 Tax=Acidiferrobacter sp. TaxID=1872107 RepID=UPI00261DB7BB|nr:hypothetical protein [Acidiferrobacter sp.]